MARSAREALEEMFDGDIQQADRILFRLAKEGFVVVPREPTTDMLNNAAFLRGDECVSYADDIPDIYHAMLAAIDGKETG